MHFCITSLCLQLRAVEITNQTTRFHGVILVTNPLSGPVSGCAVGLIIIFAVHDYDYNVRTVRSRSPPADPDLQVTASSGISGAWRRGRAAEGTRLLNEHTLKRVSWVRIPSSPPPCTHHHRSPHRELHRHREAHAAHGDLRGERRQGLCPADHRHGFGIEARIAG